MAELNERRRPISGIPGSPAPAPAGRGPRSGEPLPPPAQEWRPEPVGALREPTSQVDAATVRRAVAENDGLYRSARPAFAVLFSVVGTLGVVLMIPPFLSGAFKSGAGAALAPLLAMVGFPLFALGMYALFTGAAAAVHFQGPRVWLKTPLVYLPIALLLLLAAGAAAA